MNLKSITLSGGQKAQKVADYVIQLICHSREYATIKTRNTSVAARV